MKTDDVVFGSMISSGPGDSSSITWASQQPGGTWKPESYGGGRRAVVRGGEEGREGLGVFRRVFGLDARSGRLSARPCAEADAPPPAAHCKQAPAATPLSPSQCENKFQT